ncbi:MAG TPA: alcohol dehydrogenase catalytic domain-containing protein [Thermomicrobiales bacterium]|nr:alcohol dehydrogenase catalytic domain-containing protein [Thermomicrobiales bacterium]
MIANRISQLIDAQRSEVIEAPIPEPGAGEVLVRVTLCGVCASELHPWQDGRPGYPHRFGHEPVGVVEAIGPNVTSFKPGDRVTGLFNGAYSRYCVAPEDILLPVPDAVPDAAALGEPLACLVNAQRRTPIELADRVAIIGLGFMGLGMLQLIKLRGPSRIVAIDVREGAREQALRFGAHEVYHPADAPETYRLTQFNEWDSEKGLDVVVEGSGTEAGLKLAGEMVRAHGLLSILGYHQDGARQVDVGMWNWKAIDVVNAHVRRQADLMESMRIGLELLAARLIDLEALVTHRYGLDGVDHAYADLRDKPPGFIKGIVIPAEV